MSGALSFQPHPIPRLATEAELRGCLRDLIAISALPALWIKADDRQIATDLAQALMGILNLEFAGVSLCAAGKPRVEIKRAREDGEGSAFIDRLGGELAPGFFEISDPAGDELFRVLCLGLGGDRQSTLTAASRRPDFPNEAERMLLRVGANQAAVALRRWRGEQELRERTRTLEILNRTGAGLAANLDTRAVVQNVVDAGTELTGAAFGVFFYDGANEGGNRNLLHAFSGAAAEVFGNMLVPRNAALFVSTFRDRNTVRSEDIRRDARFVAEAPFLGAPAENLPITSYLAVPVLSRSGEIFGGLFFGHQTAGVFDERSERMAVGIAGQAAIALDNSRLYEEAQNEIERRRRMEEQQNLLLAELSHRVKNTLAIVQSISAQTLHHSTNPRAFHAAFEARVAALAQAHGLLIETDWQGVQIRALLERVLLAHGAWEGRCTLDGDDILIGANDSVGAIMLFHELATNAAKYGALSKSGGRVGVEWRFLESPARLAVRWSEIGGPVVRPPGRRGFGSRLIEASAAPGTARFEYRPGGLVCVFELLLHGRRPTEISSRITSGRSQGAHVRERRSG